MALKPDRSFESFYEVGFFVNSVAEAGGIVCGPSGLGTPGSGAAMDNANQVAEYATSASGRYALGVLCNTFVNKDLTQRTLNPYKSERQIGDKATIINKGWVTTNMLVDGFSANVVPGQPVYLGASGKLTTNSVWPQYGMQVGRIMSKADQEGYVKVRIDL